MRSDIAQGIGMFRSSDGGKTLAARSASPTRSRSAKILVDPRNPNVVLVAALGHPYGPNQERGVFRSTDGGRHWTKTLCKDEDTGAIDLAFEPGNPQRRLCRAVADAPPAVEHLSAVERARQRALQIDRRRPDVARSCAAHGFPGASGRIGLATCAARSRTASMR